MRVLICAAEAPLPPSNGLRLQVSALVRELAQRHDVRVVAFRAKDQRELEIPSHLTLVGPPPASRARDVVEIARSLATMRPYRSQMMAHSLWTAAERECRSFDPDVIHVTPGRLAALVRHLPDKPAILAALDASHLNVEARALGKGMFKRLAFKFQAAAMRRFEADLYPRFDRVVVVSEEDADELRTISASMDVVAIPNGIDLDAFSPSSAIEAEPDLLVFTGVMDYAPNVNAAIYLAQEIFPLIRAARPGARLALVGRDPHPSVEKLAEAPGVTVTGEVPSIGEWLQRVAVYVCPMRSGTGIKNKLLEALACARPCVVTPLALQGLRAEDGRDLVVGHDAASLADAALALLEDRERARGIGEAGRSYVERFHTWDGVARAYEDVYLAAMRRSKG